MYRKDEARRGGRRERAPECVLDKNNPEFTPNLLDHQARADQPLGAWSAPASSPTPSTPQHF
jgi:hypothetical protein